ncbi:UNVERIFIED_CONTAM: hypothetical protein GTU68_053014 [Idotea baltica]|nr:hypothetical protein [Idotea baltica]
MAQEIERKFLLANDRWRSEADAGSLFRQGYIQTAYPGQSVRVRLAGDAGFLTIKGPTEGLTRAEFEFAIPADDARALLDTQCGQPLIEKTRYLIERDDVVWEIDVFGGANTGLTVAEVELESEAQAFDRPDWLGEEVSYDPRYFNVALSAHPYSDW